VDLTIRAIAERTVDEPVAVWKVARYPPTIPYARSGVATRTVATLA